ncbi:unnamed protein product [Rotaria magnacalcarata]|nr:unnamed protein product [Rotaria magnacalcarata]CAF2065210.1 unnamed protein product [Rotaria magnacalcarata]
MAIFSDRSSLLVFSCLLLVVAIFGQNNGDLCYWIHCANGGVCEKPQNSTALFKCQCQFGFTGMLCEDRINITTCLKNPCLNNGVCTITNEKVIKCTCGRGSTGSRCEIII